MAASNPLASSSPLKSALRKLPPTSPTRRKYHFDSSDGSHSLRSSKRPKVEFDPSPTVHEIKPRVAGQIRDEVDRTLQRAATGDLEEYNILKMHFQNEAAQNTRRDHKDGNYEPLQPNELSDYILALAAVSKKLRDKRYRDLVKVVLETSWVGRDETFVYGFIEFLASLASFGSYLADCLDMVFDWFYDSRPHTWMVSDCPVVDQTLAEERLHRAIKRLVQVAAATSRTIVSLAAKKWPNNEDGPRVHLTYVSHLLKIREYQPEIRGELLDIIVEKVVGMDVSMQEDLDSYEDEVAVAVRRALERELVTDGQDDNSDSGTDTDDDDNDAHAGLVHIKRVKNRVKVLDAMMDLFINFHSRHFVDVESFDAKDHFNMLLSHFTKILLKTRRSRHFQFLLFHFAQKSEKLMDQFIGHCERHAFRDRGSAMADVAVAYLASFIARGANVPPHTIQRVFGRILAHLEERRKAYEPRCLGPNKELYSAYYTLFQAAIYIFCFRWQSLILSTPPDTVDPEDPLSYLNQDLDWGDKTKLIFSSNVKSKLNPLKVCAQPIVEEFATMAYRLNLIYVMPTLELNKRIRLSQYLQGSYSAGAKLRDIGSDTREDFELQMDAYFPFDPYQLPRTKPFFMADFLAWKPIPGLHAHAEESDGYDSDDEDDEDMGEGSAGEETATDMDDDDDEA